MSTVDTATGISRLPDPVTRYYKAPSPPADTLRVHDCVERPDASYYNALLIRNLRPGPPAEVAPARRYLESDDLAGDGFAFVRAAQRPGQLYPSLKTFFDSTKLWIACCADHVDRTSAGSGRGGTKPFRAFSSAKDFADHYQSVHPFKLKPQGPVARLPTRADVDSVTAQLEQTLVIKEGTPEAIEDFQDDPDWPNEAGQGADGGSDEPGRIAIGDKGKARGSPLSTPISAAVHQPADESLLQVVARQDSVGPSESVPIDQEPEVDETSELEASPEVEEEIEIVVGPPVKVKKPTKPKAKTKAEKRKEAAARSVATRKAKKEAADAAAAAAEGATAELAVADQAAVHRDNSSSEDQPKRATRGSSKSKPPAIDPWKVVWTGLKKLAECDSMTITFGREHLGEAGTSHVTVDSAEISRLGNLDAIAHEAQPFVSLDQSKALSYVQATLASEDPVAGIIGDIDQQISALWETLEVERFLDEASLEQITRLLDQFEYFAY